MPQELLTERVEKVLADLCRHTGHGGIFHSLSQPDRPNVGSGVCRFCRSCVLHAQSGAFCHNSACTAAIQGHAIGDIWYFRCWLGFDSLAIAVAPEGEIVGCIEVGGFFSPGGTEEAQQTILSRLNTLIPGSFGKLPVGALQGVREMNFKRVKGIADFLAEATFATRLNIVAQFQTRKRIHDQRERLSRRIRDLAEPSKPVHTQLLDSLNRLTGALRGDSRTELLTELDDYLGIILLRSGGDLSKAKASLLLLLAAFFREYIEMGGSWTQAVHLFEERLIDLEKNESIEDAFIWIEDVVRTVSDTGEGATGSRRRADKLSDRILAWLGENYAHKVSLADAADAVASSPSAITHKLREETGKTFTQHLSALRVSEAKRLLAYTDLSLTEIATRCGFNDQSYLTKVFRREVNMTPGQFRSMLDERVL